LSIPSKIAIHLHKEIVIPIEYLFQIIGSYQIKE